MADVPTQNVPTESQEQLLRSEDLDHPGLFINREISWLSFNERVLEEALDPEQPLLERVKFVSIYASNLDEFFMIRVSGLRQQLQAGVVRTPPDGMTPSEQLAAVRRGLLPLEPTPDGLLFVSPELASTSGDLILVRNWLSSLGTLFEEQ